MQQTMAEKAVANYSKNCSPMAYADKQIYFGKYWGLFECTDGSRFLVTYACNKAQLANSAQPS